MSESQIIQLIVLALMFFVSVYALSGLKFEKFFYTQARQKFYIFLFLISFVLAWLVTRCILSITLYGGF